MFISRYAYRSRGCKHDQSLLMLTLFMADANKPLSLELYSRSILKIYPQKKHKVTQGHWRYRPEFSKLSSADDKVNADDRCPNGNMKSRGEGNGRVRLNQLITKTVGALSPPVLPGMLLKYDKWVMRVLRHLISSWDNFSHMIRKSN